MSEEMTELESLQERANLMGLKFHPRAGVAKLKSLIDAAMNGGEDEEAEETKTDAKLSKRQQAEVKRKDLLKESGKLIRVTVSCNDPQFSKRGGVMKEVGNSFVTFKKFIPFDEEFHIPKIIVDHLKACTFTKSNERKNKNTGRKEVYYTTAKQFVVDTLEPLTEQELKDLAAQQQRSGSLED